MERKSVDVRSNPATRSNPRGEARRKALAEVAERVFLTRGFTEATMQMIAQQARASKETLYRHFTSKEMLFSEIMREKALQIFGPSGAPDLDEAPAEALYRIGVKLLETLVRPESLALLRVVIAESPRAPELGRLFWSQGPMHVQEQLTAYLSRLTDKGILACEDPALGCRLFLGSVIASHHTIALIAGPESVPSCEAIARHVREAVAVFLSRYGR